MAEKIIGVVSPERNMADDMKSWLMAGLTLIFVFLYGAALLGWLKPLTDITMVSRLEPIIFVIIGYYFGRLPAQQNEKTLKEEITRQTQKTDAAQHTKEQVLQEREALEEKVKNTKAALSLTVKNRILPDTQAESSVNQTVAGNDTTQRSVETAIKILSS